MQRQSGTSGRFSERALEWSGTAGVRGLNGAARDCAAARALEASCIADKIRSAEAEEAQG